MPRVGVDVGGTHTDLVMIDERDGRITLHKVPTTAEDPSRGTLDALVDVCASAGVSPADIDYFMHGTTVATNIALEHKGARCGLITTEGFRDILLIARHKRPQTFSLQLDLPWQQHPLVPRRFCIGVRERIVPPGRVLVPLDEDAVRGAVRRLVAEGVEAIAVCFLFSFLDPCHEMRAGDIVREEAPGVFLSMSHQVVPQYREYERFSTTALNAYVAPRTSAYLARLSEQLQEHGVHAGLHVMQSSGGAATHKAAAQRPVTLLMSGPAAGLIGGIWVGRDAGFNNVITLDVGGTSADIGVAPGGQVLYKHILDTRLGDYHAMVPMAQVDSIGAGGGSIAYVDSGGQFQVGPESAGSDPGPCCYGRGGTRPTATDCLLVLGRIDPDGFLGGRQRLDKQLATRAIAQTLGPEFGHSVEAAALGAIKILTHNMVQAIELNSVRRGHDPRDFALIAFGGGGPMFAADIARELGIPRVVVPLAPGLTSAFGLLATDVSYELSRTVARYLDGVDLDELATIYRAMETELLNQLKADGFAVARMRLLRFADCRYRGQGYELRTPVKSGEVDRALLADLRPAFDAEHQRAYGRCSPRKDVQIVNIGIVGIGLIDDIAQQEIAPGEKEPPQGSIHRGEHVVFEVENAHARLDTPRYRRELLRAGNDIRGPAIVDQMDATTVLPPGFAATVDRFGNLVIAVPQEPWK
jgi:N-methylhydantoinase A/oxoprolinase/acetone carboxylase beta subunit